MDIILIDVCEPFLDVRCSHAWVDSLFHSDEQPELNLENDYPNKTGHNLKTKSSISIL